MPSTNPTTELIMAEVELDEKAVEAAVEAYESSPCMDLIGPMEAAIRAYLRTAGLVSVPVMKEGEL